ncbi:hypothetical protein Hanom_Chr12g01174721 [Helianthus anomalus]
MKVQKSLVKPQTNTNERMFTNTIERMIHLFMFVHLTNRMEFLVYVCVFIKRTNINELTAEHFTNGSLNVRLQPYLGLQKSRAARKQLEKKLETSRVL